MRMINRLAGLLVVVLFFLSLGVYASEEALNIELSEYVYQEVTYNPLKTGGGIWYDLHENQSYYNLSGYITVTNVNPEGLTLSDIYITFYNTTDITLPVHYAGRNGTFVQNDTSSGVIVLHIPELKAGENSTWYYEINVTSINPPLNFTSNYSDSKVLAGNNITITDTIENVFNNYPYQTNTCIYDINITQVTVPVNFSGTYYDFYFIPSTTTGLDAGNVTYSSDNLTQYWKALNFSCLDKGNKTYITYTISTPLNIPKTTHYKVVNSTLMYKLNETISHVRVTNIRAVSEAQMNVSKRIVGPSHPVLYGSNVTWNVTSSFSVSNNLSYTLESIVLWVSKRNVVGSYTDPNYIDNDTISGAPLKVVFTPFVEVNKTNSWISSTWLFNYSDIPSPIVWMDVNFTLSNDGIQLINRSITQQGRDIYIKELYLIIGYWLEIEKNVTAINNDTYHVRIFVHNKGNQVTPADTVVTIYDFIPQGFNLSSNFVFSSSPWYNTTVANASINGYYNGTLYQFGLIPTNSLNTSFAAGPDVNENTSWSVDYNVTGVGDYQLTDVFITGLDPMQVDGAGSTKAVIISEVINKLRSREGVFATIASILALLAIII